MNISSANHMSRLKWLLLGIGAIFLARHIIVTNVSELLAQSGDAQAAASALRWDGAHAQALYLQGLDAARKNPAEALQYLDAAARHNPAEGRSYAVIGRIKEIQGDLPAAERAMRIASQMAPRRLDVQQEVSAFWMRRGNVAQALEHMNVVLTFGDSLRSMLFPDLLQLAENQVTRAAYVPLLRQPIPWWPQFFGYAAANAVRVETLRALFEMQSDGPNTATADGLRAYLKRLQREGYWTESYFVWLNGLRKDQLNNIGNLFNGSFEEPLSNIGFDWMVEPAGQILAETASTYGTTGSKALRVTFRGPRVQYQHLGQHLLLDPGAYTLYGRGRPESLETAKGVQWSIYCLGQAEPLASSERFIGTDQWRRFSVQFEVPANDCPVQLARLELAGRTVLDFEAKGVVWFDDLSIDRQRVD